MSAAMTPMRAIAALAAVLLAGNAAPGQSDFSEIRAAWAEARTAARSDLAAALPRYDALVAAAKGNGGVLLSAISVAAKAQDRARLARWLALFVGQGGGLAADDRAEIAALLGAGSAGVLAQAARHAEPLGNAETLASIPGDLPLIEGIARDPQSGALFTTSVTTRQIEGIARDGTRTTVRHLTEAEGFPMGLAFDSRNGLLWAAVDSAPFREDKSGAGGVMRISAKSGAHALIGAAPGTKLNIGDIALATDGSVFAADSQSGAIYRCPPGCAELSLLVPAGRLRSAQGMAVSANGRRLYVADYGYGLLAIDTRDGTTVRVDAAPGIALDGIDGLALRAGKLIAVQNGWTPARVIEIGLDRAGTMATSLRVLARGAPAAEAPGQFAFGRGGEVLMVANSQWARLEKPEASRSPAVSTRLVRLIEAKAGRR